MEETANIPMAAKVLDYATYDADGLPPFVREVEELIDQRAHLPKIRKYFASADQACKYFAKSMRRRFSLAGVGSQCVGCGQACSTAAGVKWQISLPLKWNEFKLTNKQPHAHFLTYHAICGTCARRWIKTLKWVDRFSKAWTTFRFGWLALVLVISQIGRTMRGKWSLYLGFVWPIYFVLIFTSAFLLRWWKQRTIPRGLRHVMLRRVSLKSLEIFDERDRLLIQPPAESP